MRDGTTCLLPLDAFIEPARPAPRRSRQARVDVGLARCHRRRRCAGARAGDDQHRHGRCDRHRDPGQGAGHRRFGDGSHHGQHARSRGAGAVHPRAARPHGHRRAADRRLPLQRPSSAHRLSGLRRDACRSTASTRATSARATSTTGSSRRWSRSRRRFNKPVRIGVNWGSLDQELLDRADGRERAPARALRAAADHVSRDPALGDPVGDGAPRKSAWRRSRSSCLARCPACRISSASIVRWPKRCDYPLHLGLTEAGMGTKGTVASTAALALLLQDGIGDTIRVSLTPQPGEARTQEVVVALEILQSLGLRSFNPSVTACPGCGRTTSTTFQELAKEIDDFLRAQMPVWKQRYPGVEKMKVRGDGLHRQRPWREQACRHRHQPAGHRRSTGSAGLHRRREGVDAARRQHRRRVPRAGRALHREALRQG